MSTHTERKHDERIAALIRRGSRVVQEFSDAHLETHASSISFFMFMSMIPVLVILACAVSRLGYSEQELVMMVGSAVPAALKSMIETMVRESYESASFAIGFSMIVLLWTATQGSAAIMRGLNAVYDQEETRKPLVVILYSLLAVVVLIVLLVAAVYFIFSSRIVRLLSRLMPMIPFVGSQAGLFSMIFLFAICILVFSLCYAFLPSGRRSWRDQLPGAIIASIAMVVLSYVFRFFVDSETSIYAVFYGSFATITIFMFWMFLVFQILLFGAFFNRCRMEWRTGEHFREDAFSTEDAVEESPSA